MAMRKRENAILQEARPRIAAILQVICVGPEQVRTDEELLWAVEAERIKHEHDTLCARCAYTVDTCHECKYNGQDFTYRRYDNPFLSCIPLCAKYKTQQEQKRIAKLMGVGGVGERFRSRSFATFQETSATRGAVHACKRFCDEVKHNPKAQGLMLMGGYGTGKTHLAVAILRETAEAGIPGMFVVVPDLLGKMRASFGQKDGKAEELVTTAKNAQLLVLDDLGAENPSPWVVELVYVLINHRYEHMLPTVITTNCSGRELEATFGRRIVSRLAEMTVPVNIRAEDYRMKGAC
nr:ATP-binding protein [uncultured Selenomonas sp.]